MAHRALFLTKYFGTRYIWRIFVQIRAFSPSWVRWQKYLTFCMFIKHYTSPVDSSKGAKSSKQATSSVAPKTKRLVRWAHRYHSPYHYCDSPVIGDPCKKKNFHIKKALADQRPGSIIRHKQFWLMALLLSKRRPPPVLEHKNASIIIWNTVFHSKMVHIQRHAIFAS